MTISHKLHSQSLNDSLRAEAVKVPATRQSRDKFSARHKPRIPLAGPHISRDGQDDTDDELSGAHGPQKLSAMPLRAGSGFSHLPGKTAWLTAGPAPAPAPSGANTRRRENRSSNHPQSRFTHL
ncbi:hypothetical protein ACFYQQ_31650 [Streptomyces sp. NPDC005496]|uniref:hypothetical protein n=1 Tax=unclassified Streptomyces TaxID=2593676 RepID=UPI0033AF1CC2